MIADDLSRIAMSSSLHVALSRGVELARRQGHLEVTLEHMLLSLCEDAEAVLVLAASNVDIVRLKADASKYVSGLQLRAAPGQIVDPTVSPDLRRILEAAAAAARGGRRREINGAIVLAAIVGDGRSPAAQLLQAQGLTFDGAIRALQGGGAASRPRPPDTEEILASARERVQSRTLGRKPDASRAPDEGAPPEPAAPAAKTDSVDYDDVPPTAPPRVERPVVQEPEPPEIMARPAPAVEGPPPKQESPLPPMPASAPLPPPIPVPAASTSWTPASPAPFPPAAPAPFPPAAPARHAPPPLPPVRVGGEAAPSPAPVARWPEGAEPRRPMGVGSGDASIRPPAHISGRRFERTLAGSPTPASRPVPAQRAEVGQLVENIPRIMRVAIPVLVEVRVARANVQALAEGLQGGGAAYRHEVTVTKAMSVRLRAPDGGFFIETASPETQWIEKTMLLSSDDYASWRWHITPREKGRKRLQLIISARTVSADGLAAETALPDQVITVRVRTNYAKVATHWVGWGVAALAGGLLAKFGEGALDAGWQFASKLMSG